MALSCPLREDHLALPLNKSLASKKQGCSLSSQHSRSGLAGFIFFIIRCQLKSVDFSLFPTLQASLSSTILQSCLHHRRGTLHLYAAVHQCRQRPPKGLGSNKTVEATKCRSSHLYNCMQCQEEWGAAQTACSQV